MEHACSRIQSYISKQLLLEAPGMLHTHWREVSLYMHVPFDLSLAVQTCRSWELLCACGETDWSYGLITSCCLASVAWLNLHSQSVLRITCIAIAYPDPDTPVQQTVGAAIAVLNKMVDDTDNQKKVEMPRIIPLCALPGTHKLIYNEFHRYPPVYKSL